jgi:20S proteasome alpha/beta subunit
MLRPHWRYRSEDAPPRRGRQALRIDEVTVGIAAIVPTAERQIVVASDAMISFGDWSIPAADETIRKSYAIAGKWGVLFAATDTTAFQPVFFGIREALGFNGLPDTNDHEAEVVRTAAQAAYEKEFNYRFFTRHLARFGFEDVSEFKRDGFSQMGKEFHAEYSYKLATFDLGLELLVYGFDPHGNPHVFEVENPGQIKNHDFLHYAAIGTGSNMAYAALARKKLTPGLEETIYRVLDAKFSAETATGVGKKTHVVTMTQTGKLGFMAQKEIEDVRSIWQKLMKQTEPKDAIEVISTSRAVTHISDGER